MSDDIDGRPAVLGGMPARSWPVPTHPVYAAGRRGFDEGECTGRWLRAASGEPAGRRGGVPLGMELADGIYADDVVSASAYSAQHGIAEALGEEPARFAAELAAVLSGGHRVAVVPGGSGSATLVATFAAVRELAGDLGLRPTTGGGEMIVSALCRHSTAWAIVGSGFVPVPIDVDPENLCADPRQVADNLRRDTVAVVVSHQAPRLASVREIVEIAEPHGIPVIEDCTDAPGARSVDHVAGPGTVGLAGVFSFGTESNTLTGGGGGALVSREPGLAMETARQLQKRDYDMPGVLAALLRAQLRRFPDENSTRVRVLARLEEQARGLPDIRVLPADPEVAVPPTNGWLFGVNLDRFDGMTLDQVAAALAAELRCEVSRIRKPLTVTDDRDLRRTVGGAHARHAEAAYASTLVIPAAAMLDVSFPGAFREAVTKTRQYAPELAAAVNAR